ncbi:hypothetical protein PULV_b0017 [Pseudoalteromonas ulvae UL12]|nr:hypothetical protein [Pseudoalteromonas ulvae UL12]
MNTLILVKDKHCVSTEHQQSVNKKISSVIKCVYGVKTDD